MIRPVGVLPTRTTKRNFVLERLHHYKACYVYELFQLYILKRKSFATLIRMQVPFVGPKQSLSDNAIDKSLYLPCIQHKNQNGVAYGCRAATIILMQPPILKSHGYNNSHVVQKIFFFNQYLFSKVEWKTN